MCSVACVFTYIHTEEMIQMMNKLILKKEQLPPPQNEKMRSHYLAEASLKLLDSSHPPVSAPPNTRTYKCVPITSVNVTCY